MQRRTPLDLSRLPVGSTSAAGTFSPTGRPNTFDVPSVPGIGPVLALTQSRVSGPRIVREVMASQAVDWLGTDALGVATTFIHGRVVLIAGDRQALQLTAVLPGSDFAGRVNGRIVFDSAVMSIGLTTFRFSHESGPLIEPDEWLTGLLVYPWARGTTNPPGVGGLPWAYGSLAIACETPAGLSVRGTLRGEP